MNSMTRRDFGKFLAGAGGMALLGSAPVVAKAEEKEIPLTLHSTFYEPAVFGAWIKTIATFPILSLNHLRLENGWETLLVGEPTLLEGKLGIIRIDPPWTNKHALILGAGVDRHVSGEIVVISYTEERRGWQGCFQPQCRCRMPQTQTEYEIISLTPKTFIPKREYPCGLLEYPGKARLCDLCGERARVFCCATPEYPTGRLLCWNHK